MASFSPEGLKRQSHCPVTTLLMLTYYKEFYENRFLIIWPVYWLLFDFTHYNGRVE